jgi:hypothetical protein
MAAARKLNALQEASAGLVLMELNSKEFVALVEYVLNVKEQL